MVFKYVMCNNGKYLGWLTYYGDLFILAPDYNNRSRWVQAWVPVHSGLSFGCWYLYLSHLK